MNCFGLFCSNSSLSSSPSNLKSTAIAGLNLRMHCHDACQARIVTSIRWHLNFSSHLRSFLLARSCLVVVSNFSSSPSLYYSLIINALPPWQQTTCPPSPEIVLTRLKITWPRRGWASFWRLFILSNLCIHVRSPGKAQSSSRSRPAQRGLKVHKVHGRVASVGGRRL